MNPDELRRQLACPLCGRPMLAHPYLGPGNIVIDTCDTCNVIWLDYGELDRAVNAPGRDRGSALLKRQQERARSRSADDDEDETRRGIDLFDVFTTLFS
jgi:Zn-finger nucleic acid-binding protein